ncbi:hypothetical protein QOZ80_3AG0222990 [Eleusine coracana subsp. coracana]|nr:hypothetical protein QOZ80_3AG0222990 [Eleusine coracana subsp. coracana]
MASTTPLPPPPWPVAPCTGESRPIPDRRAAAGFLPSPMPHPTFRNPAPSPLLAPNIGARSGEVVPVLGICTGWSQMDGPRTDIRLPNLLVHPSGLSFQDYSRLLEGIVTAVEGNRGDWDDVYSGSVEECSGDSDAEEEDGVHSLGAGPFGVTVDDEKVMDAADSDEEDTDGDDSEDEQAAAASAKLQYEYANINSVCGGSTNGATGETTWKKRKRWAKGNEAYDFCNLYSWEVGAGVCFGSSADNRETGYQTVQEIVCKKEGFDARCTNSSKRVRCKAMVRLHRTEDHGWYVSHHVKEHNDPLSVSCGEKREWNSHNKIDQSTKDMIRYLRENNVTLSRVHCIMGSMFGGMENIPFNQRSLRSVCSQMARDQKDDDWGKTLEIFKQMRAEDPGFQFAVDFTKDMKVKTLLWASGKSRSDYNFFGDVITFDTTYCTNLYKMPFGIFVGVNNHFQSVPFAGVLMRDEKATSFKWVFNEFITLMVSKHPITILTDQCKAMTKAVKKVMSEANHLWCKWHVFNSAPEELGLHLYGQNAPFRKEFHYVINQMLTIEEFERAWQHLLDTYHLHEQYRKLLYIRASAEHKAEHKTKQYVDQRKRIEAVERHASTVYTHKVFELFREETNKCTDYKVVQCASNYHFTVIHNNSEKRQLWKKVAFDVTVSNDGELYSCECGLFEHFGMLCCHAIKVMIHCGVNKIPEGHILKRWTRSAEGLGLSRSWHIGIRSSNEFFDVCEYT